MTAGQLLADLTDQGVVITHRGDRLLVDAPIGVVDRHLREALVHHKTELLTLLKSEDDSADEHELVRAAIRIFDAAPCDPAEIEGAVPAEEIFGPDSHVHQKGPPDPDSPWAGRRFITLKNGRIVTRLVRSKLPKNARSWCLEGDGKWQMVANDEEPVTSDFQTTAITFGKHRGTEIADLPDSYLHWLWCRCDRLKQNPALEIEVAAEIYDRIDAS